MNEKHSDKKFETRAVWSGTQNIEGSAVTPIFSTATYQLTDERYAGWAAGAQHTALYSRLSSINSEGVAMKLAQLEGAEDGETFASGMAAISTTLMSLLSKGDHMIASADCYGGAYGLMVEDLPRFGIEVTMADMRDPASYEAAIQENTKILYVETITNPVIKVCDLEAMAALAKKHNLIAVVDNTFATPVNQNPIALGFDAVVHAATKAIGGHSDVTAGVICSTEEIIAGCWGFLKILGASLSPFEAWLLLRGLKTLELRVLRQNQSALELARFLESREDIEKVNYPGLESHLAHELASSQMSGFGGMLSFELSGGVERGMSFADQLAVIQPAVSLGGAESILQHPASMSHGALGEEELRKAGISGGLFRLSVGLENPGDLETDLQQALDKSKAN